MTNVMVIHPTVQCMINRNLCQKTKDYLTINGFKICNSLSNADIIIFSGCGVLESNEIEGLHLIQFIKNFIVNSNEEKKFILVGCLPQINEKTKGMHKNSKNIYEELRIDPDFKKNSKSQFIIVDNYDYKVLDELIDAKVKFNHIPNPTKISARNGLDQISIMSNVGKDFINEDLKSQKKNYMDLISTQLKIAKEGFLYPASNDYLLAYGYRQIIIGEGCKNNCAFCAVKFAKNKIKSVTIDVITNQIEKLLAKGENKFVLVADDIGSWGIDIGLKWIDLLEAIDKISNNNINLALFNIKAEDLLNNKDIIDKLVYKRKITYLCVMSQHVNKRLLKYMNREPFEKTEFINMINEYGSKGIQIETFLIIGFPSETKEEFLELVDFIKSIKTEHFANYSTPFSSRFATAAFNYKEQIPKKIIMERVNFINEVYIESSIERFSKLSTKLRNNLIKLLLILKEHEINYELVSDKKVLELEK